MDRPFESIYSHQFARVSVCVPSLKVADPKFNVQRTIELASRASSDGAIIALFPELGISAYTNDDLFHQDALLDAVKTGVHDVLKASIDLNTILLIGAPLRFDNKLFNCCVVILDGKILGIVPKSYLPTYREFYEKRQFTSGRDALSSEVNIFGKAVPFGANLLFESPEIEGFSLFVEICEDVWTPLPPSTFGALAGATVLANLSASNITVGKADDRRKLCSAQSSRCVAAYLYSAAGPGESTTDLAWDGQASVFENGDLLIESDRFPDGERIITIDIDLGRLVQERMRLTSFNDQAGEFSDRVQSFRRIHADLSIPTGDQIKTLKRQIQRFPYVPSDPALRNEQCYEAYNIQVHGLIKRLQSTGIEKVVIGISGGLDSTHALIVAAKAFDQLKLPRTNILGYTMPGFATSHSTQSNAHVLMNALDISASEIDIKPSCMRMLEDIKHPFIDGKPVYDITFENVQAGERTSHLFRLANFNQALVVGTGDLSELALGWATYGVGDHMSHYNVNVSVSKTLIQHLIRWVVLSKQFDDITNKTLLSILDTEISPELVPITAKDGKSSPIQSTEAKIGPYELQDFNLYYISRYGFRPSKVAFLALQAWKDLNTGDWPEGLAPGKRHEYDLPAIKRWLREFLWRFFKTSQFKRSCIPNGPKVGSGGSLSPRGDWRAPSDSEATPWIDELERNVP